MGPINIFFILLGIFFLVLSLMGKGPLSPVGIFFIGLAGICFFIGAKTKLTLKSIILPIILFILLGPLIFSALAAMGISFPFLGAGIGGMIATALLDVFGPPKPEEMGQLMCSYFLPILDWLFRFLGMGPAKISFLCLSNPLAILVSIATFVIIYGFLDEIRIFYNKTINLILALTIMFASISSGAFIVIVSRLFRLMGYYGVGIFSMLFFVGVWYYYQKRRAEWQTVAGVYSIYSEEEKHLRTELAMITRDIGETTKRLARETDPTRRAEIEKSLITLSDKRRDIEERLDELARVRRRT